MDVRIFTNPLQLIQRLRHTYGFGVHSPFAFELIKDTIHTPHSYYIYNENRIKIEELGLSKQVDIKYAELLFRLVNRFNSKNILEIGSGFGINTLYISKLSKQTSVVCVEKDDEKSKIAEQLLANKMGNLMFKDALSIEMDEYDAVFWDLKLFPLQSEETLESIIKCIKQDGFIVLNHIKNNKRNKQVWQNVQNIDKLTMSFDLGSIGISFFKPSLPKLCYDIYF